MARKLLFLLSLFLFFTQAKSQKVDFHFTELNHQKGLSELSTAYFSTDSRGFTWIGTRNGLNRFDGKGVVSYQPKLSNGTKDPNLSSKIFEDDNGSLWFSTSNAIYNWNPETDSLGIVQLDLKGETEKVPDYHLFFIDKSNRLWFSACGGLYIYDSRIKEFEYKLKFESFWAYPHTDTNGELVGLSQPLLNLGTGIEFLHFDQECLVERDTFFSFYNKWNHPPIFTIFFHVENDSTIWIPCDIGLIKFNPFKPLSYKLYKPQNFSDVGRLTDAKPWKNNLIWVSSKKIGLFLFDTNKEQFIQNDSLIWVDNRFVDIKRINNLYLDEQNNLWLSMWGKGVYVSNLEIVKFQQISVPSEKLNQAMSVIAITDNGTDELWVGVQEKGLVRFIKEHQIDANFQNFDKRVEENVTGTPIAFLKEDNGDIWVVTLSTLNYWNKEKNEFLIKGYSQEGFRNIAKLEANLYLILVNNKLYTISKNSKNVDFGSLKPILTKDEVSLFYTDFQNLIYLSDGINQLEVYKYYEGKLNLLARLNDVGAISGVVTHPTGKTTWLASANGLVELNQENYKYKFLEDKQNILSQEFNCIFIDHSEQLWLTGNHEVVMYDTKKGQVFEFSYNDGLPSTQFEMAAGYQDKSGNIYFGNKNGLVTFHPDSIKLNETLPKVHITNLTINDNDTLKAKDILVAKHKTFPYAQNTLSFTFAAIEYSAPEENQFKYYLEGYDKDTVDNGTEGFARYPNLPAGDYTLNVWGSNSDDVWTKEPKQLEITILPPWYETWWFRTLASLGVLGIFYAIYRYRIAQIQKEASYKQLVAETETAVLRLQMNPHFIFNSMNSISSYIMQKDLDNAHDFLARFARLMRNILNSSEKQFHSVGEEIELLEQYMDIEKRRFKEPFQYEFTIENIEDTDDVLIPTMILQPFVENAIWHGVAGIGSTGVIDIFFEIHSGKLVCGVSDNGIGRKAAKNTQLKTYESKAISITQKRLNLLKREEQIAPTLQISDNADFALIGTKVVIQIPLEYLG